jgi:rod shape-determining protein MreD
VTRPEAIPARTPGSAGSASATRIGNLVLRIALLGFFFVLLESVAFSDATVLGAPVDVIPLLVAFTGLTAGSMAGAAAGFGVGLLADLVLVQTLGVSSLLLVPIGYGAGRLRELRDPHHTLVPLAVGAAATFLYAAGTSVVQIMLGVGAPMSYLLIRDVLAVTLVNAILSLPVHALVRRVLQGALPDDTRRRRRRAYTTGGLSPLTSSSDR